MGKWMGINQAKASKGDGGMAVGRHHGNISVLI